MDFSEKVDMKLSEQVEKLERRERIYKDSTLKAIEEIEYFVTRYDSDDYLRLLPANRSYHTKDLRRLLSILQNNHNNCVSLTNTGA